MAPDTAFFGAEPSGITSESRVRNIAFNSAFSSRISSAENGVSQASGHGNANGFAAHSGACPAVSGLFGHTRDPSVSGPLKGVRPDTRWMGARKGGRS